MASVVRLAPPPARNAALEAAHAAERLERRCGLVGGQLASIGHEDELGGWREALPNVLGEAGDRAERAGQRGQRGEQVRPALFNPQPNLLLLCEGQERPFAELAEVHPHEVRILVRDGPGLEHLFGLGDGLLLQLVLVIVIIRPLEHGLVRQRLRLFLPKQPFRRRAGDRQPLLVRPDGHEPELLGALTPVEHAHVALGLDPIDERLVLATWTSDEVLWFEASWWP